ncbi:MAG TPA: PRC-barrel domain-containing protein [Candidatus Limnocylindria bacterium]|nr:PRC-barrel domain-containing protein [Candidatus Limnocylindria bacterium]
MAVTLTRELKPLTRGGVTLADPASDVRGREVLDRDGRHVGTVVDVLADPVERVARLVHVSIGGAVLGLGRKQRLIPFEVVTRGDPRTAYVERTREEILAAEEYRPGHGDLEAEQYHAAYAAYGVTPHWLR